MLALSFSGSAPAVAGLLGANGMGELELKTGKSSFVFLFGVRGRGCGRRIGAGCSFKPSGIAGILGGGILSTRFADSGVGTLPDVSLSVKAAVEGSKLSDAGCA